MAPEIVIVGAGVIGCSIAYALARAGAGRIVVIDSGLPGAGASNAAAGMLVVASSRAPRGVLFELRRASLALFPEWIAALEQETGLDVGYQTQGLLELAFTDAEAQALKSLVSRRQVQGFAARDLDLATARELEPAISMDAAHAALFPTDCSVNNVRLVEALHQAASARGVMFRLGTPVTAIETAGTHATAVVAGERFTPGRLIIAAGLGSRAIGGLLRLRIPVRPDKGEMLALRPPAPIKHMVVWNDGYLVPRKDGELIVGGTTLRGAADTTVTPSTLAFSLRRATRMVPALADATTVRSWAGVRPLSELRRPVIGPARGYANVVIATGHHRNGILLAPITAQLVTELITRNATSIPIHPFCHKSR